MPTYYSQYISYAFMCLFFLTDRYIKKIGKIECQWFIIVKANIFDSSTGLVFKKNFPLI